MLLPYIPYFLFSVPVLMQRWDLIEFFKLNSFINHCNNCHKFKWVTKPVFFFFTRSLSNLIKLWFLPVFMTWEDRNVWPVSSEVNIVHENYCSWKSAGFLLKTIPGNILLYRLGYIHPEYYWMSAISIALSKFSLWVIESYKVY